jgi:hypothetical protein
MGDGAVDIGFGGMAAKVAISVWLPQDKHW